MRQGQVIHDPTQPILLSSIIRYFTDFLSKQTIKVSSVPLIPHSVLDFKILPFQQRNLQLHYNASDNFYVLGPHNFFYIKKKKEKEKSTQLLIIMCPFNSKYIRLNYDSLALLLIIDGFIFLWLNLIFDGLPGIKLIQCIYAAKVLPDRKTQH